MFLQQMPLPWLLNLLLTSKGVVTFPGLSSFQDAALSGVTIPNPSPNLTGNQASGLSGGTYSATIPVVTRAQVLTAFKNLVSLYGAFDTVTGQWNTQAYIPGVILNAGVLAALEGPTISQVQIVVPPAVGGNAMPLTVNLTNASFPANDDFLQAPNQVS